MTSPTLPPADVAVLLPGSGSDDVFLHTVFAGPLAAVGIELRAHRPGPSVVAGYLRALDEAAASTNGRLLVGGVSLGAHVAVQWAARNPGRCVGVLAALPAYTGRGDTAPAAVAARYSAGLLQTDGLEHALSIATAGVPDWLAAELARAWRRQADVLIDGLNAAARHPGPAPAELRELRAPVGIAGCVGDAVHPVAVARQWSTLIPQAALSEITFEQVGADHSALGRAALDALARATRQPGQTD